MIQNQGAEPCNNMGRVDLWRRRLAGVFAVCGVDKIHRRDAGTTKNHVLCRTAGLSSADLDDRKNCGLAPEKASAGSRFS
jgi:hypothetical protein